MENKEKLYEVNGFLQYAHCFRAEVKANSPKEAKEKVEKNLDYYKDPASAEYQEGIVDLGIEIEEEESDKEVAENIINNALRMAKEKKIDGNKAFKPILEEMRKWVKKNLI